MIHDVVVAPLRRLADERGAVLHMLRADAPSFAGFGEIYFSLVYPGAVKAWHWHARMLCRYAVPVGAIHLVLYDDRPDSPTRGAIQELHVGEASYCLVTIPPRLWSGFRGEGASPALVANCASIPHDPAESRRLAPSDPAIPFRWA